MIARKSVNDGYVIQLQIEYDTDGYTITLVKQPGEVTLKIPMEDAAPEPAIKPENTE